MRRIVLGCGVILLGALPFYAARVRAQNDSASAANAHANSAATATTSGSSAAAPKGPTVRTIAHAVNPTGLAVDSQGRIYFSAGNRVYRVDPSAGSNAPLEIVAGTGQRGSLGDGGAATAAQLDFTPRLGFSGGLAVDGAGNLYIVDTGNDTIRRVDAQTGVISSVAGHWANNGALAEFVNLGGMGADAAGHIFFSSSLGGIRAEPSSGGIISFNKLSDTVLAVTPDGLTVYEASRATGGVTRTALQANGEPLPSAPGFFPLAAFGYAPGPRNPASITWTGMAPGLAVDATGNIFVAEPQQNLIERIDAKTSAAATFAGTGTAGYSGDGGAPLTAEFNAPSALAFDRDGNLFIADTANNAIREITQAAHVSGVVTLTPNTFTFPTQLVGGGTAPEPFTLTNNSGVTVTGITVQFFGENPPLDFTQTNDCGGQLAASASCTIKVVFDPQQTGTRNAALNVTDSDPSSPQTAALSGVGDDFELAIQPSGTTTLTVIAGGMATYMLQATPDNVFSGTVTPNCPFNLPLQTTCTITPTTLTLAAGGGPQTFTLAIQTVIRLKSGSIFAPQPANGAPGNQAPRFPAPGAIGFGIFAALIAVLIAMTGAPKISSKRALKFWLLPASAIVLLLVFAPGCNNSTTTTSTLPVYTGTPAGTYTFNVTASAQNAERAVSITLIVQ
ncbi:MAG: choice-of-anchor D domain-containing protein [Candidatus Acidiferrales bacterium]